MKRRQFLGYGVGLLGALGFNHRAARAAAVTRTRPNAPGWPSEADWASLKDAVGGRLQPVTLPALEPADAAKLLANPYFLRDQAALTQSSGFIDGWRSSPSVYVVKAANAQDVAAAVKFAKAHRIRLVVKGGGHSYLGGSNAPDSLLLWTRDLEAIDLHDDFVPQGSSAAPAKAVSVGAGCVWLHVYEAVTGKAGRYVQGGGCTSVGVAGLVQGGGFGSLSKTFGLAAASLLEAEIVTADGEIRIVNEAQEPDLFWALKGGGGGTFGVVTRLTLKTHDLPAIFGAVLWQVEANSDEAFRTMLDRFIAHYAKALFNPNWGEQVQASGRNKLAVTMFFQGLDEAAAHAAWAPLESFVAANAADYKILQPLTILSLPAQSFWNGAFLDDHAKGVVVLDDRPDANPGDYWWASNTEEAGTFWHGYTSAWMPASLLDDDNRARLVDAWFNASRLWSVSFHFNKGLAGCPVEARNTSRDTAMNPQVLDAFALAIIAEDGPSAFSGIAEPDLDIARQDADSIRDAMKALRKAAPGAGSYLSECDYALADWQTACWGGHWQRLSDIKRRYDPDGLFIVHHGVGSENWSPNGFDRVAR